MSGLIYDLNDIIFKITVFCKMYDKFLLSLNLY